MFTRIVTLLAFKIDPIFIRVWQLFSNLVFTGGKATGLQFTIFAIIIIIISILLLLIIIMTHVHGGPHTHAGPNVAFRALVVGSLLS